MSRRRRSEDTRPGTPVAIVCTGGGAHDERVLEVVRVLVVAGPVQVAHQRQDRAGAVAPWIDAAGGVGLTEAFRCDVPGCGRSVRIDAERLEAIVARAAASGEVVDIARMSA